LAIYEGVVNPLLDAILRRLIPQMLRRKHFPTL
jgi:hypothetical protein